MATDPLYFLIEDCPGPFQLIMGYGHMLERHGNHQEFDLTLKPVETGIEFLGHDKKFKIPFEVMLTGATTKYSHGINEPRNVRFFGRFLIPGKLQPHIIDPTKAAPELNAWQWEVVFNALGRTTGFVAKLDNPLPEEWSM